MAYEGQAMVNAQKIAIDKINGEGGINGRMLELVAKDSLGTSSAVSYTHLDVYKRQSIQRADHHHQGDAYP